MRDRDLLGAAAICAAGIIIILLLAGCAPAPVVRPPVADLPSPWVTMHIACGHQPADGLVPCEVEGLRRAALQSIDLHEAAELCRADLEEARSLAAVDAAELRGAVARAEAERDRMAGQRWVWAAVGAAAGTIIAGLIAGLAGR